MRSTPSATWWAVVVTPSGRARVNGKNVAADVVAGLTCRSTPSSSRQLGPARQRDGPAGQAVARTASPGKGNFPPRHRADHRRRSVGHRQQHLRRCVPGLLDDVEPVGASLTWDRTCPRQGTSSGTTDRPSRTSSCLRRRPYRSAPHRRDRPGAMAPGRRSSSTPWSSPRTPISRRTRQHGPPGPGGSRDDVWRPTSEAS